MANVPTRRQILTLYRQYLTASQSFSSYNFRTYFLRRSRDLFRSNLLPASQATLSSPFSPAAATTALKSPPTLTSTPLGAGTDKGAANTKETGPKDDKERLAAFYASAKKDLEVLRRSALTNRMYEGERLVVEKPQLIVGGGGAGAEASVGGGGQPTMTDQGKGEAPASG